MPSTDPGNGHKQESAEEQQVVRRGSKEDMRRRFKEWERLRTPYNAVMLPVGLFVSYTVYRSVSSIPQTVRGEMLYGLSPLMFVVLGSIAFAVAANVLYFLGYAAEATYIEFTKWKWGSKKRFALMVLGLVFSIGVEVAVWLRFTGLADKYVR